MHADLIKELERMGQVLGLEPSDLWAMAGVERSVWQRLRRGDRQAGLPNHLKLEALKSKLSTMKPPKRRGKAA